MVQLLEDLADHLPYTLKSLHVIFRLVKVSRQGSDVESDWIVVSFVPRSEEL